MPFGFGQGLLIVDLAIRPTPIELHVLGDDHCALKSGHGINEPQPLINSLLIPQLNLSWLIDLLRFHT